MKVIKGFHKDMTCGNFQFEEGKTYEEPIAKLCESGFHAVEAPLDVFKYYSPAYSVYHECDLYGVSEERKNDSKVCGARIKVGKRLNIASLVKLQFDYIKNNIEDSKFNKNLSFGNNATTASSGNDSASATCGDYSVSASSGRSSTSASIGDYSTTASSGSFSSSASSGDYSVSASSGRSSTSVANGYSSASTSNGDYSTSVSNGDLSISVSIGDYSESKANGEKSIAVAIGFNAKASASLGSFIAVEDWRVEGCKFKRYGIKSAIVDGKNIKPDTFYSLVNGEFVEAKYVF